MNNESDTFKVGDNVVMNGISPKYLNGKVVTITAVNQTRVKVEVPNHPEYRTWAGRSNVAIPMDLITKTDLTPPVSLKTENPAPPAQKPAPRKPVSPGTFKVGDKVVVNGISPKYLNGKVVTITAVNQTRVKVDVPNHPEYRTWAGRSGVTVPIDLIAKTDLIPPTPLETKDSAPEAQNPVHQEGIKVGDQVILQGISPKYLNGKTVTVTAVNRTRVKVDVPNDPEYRTWAGRSGVTVPMDLVVGSPDEASPEPPQISDRAKFLTGSIENQMRDIVHDFGIIDKIKNPGSHVD